jgi:hypothetical protein
MKKRFVMMMMALAMSAASFAQFEQGKIYANAAFSGFNADYTGADKWKIDLNLKGGYFFEDSWMIFGQMGYGYRENDANTFLFGAGMRYYIVENGMYLGGSANYCHTSLFDESVSDFMPSLHIGYAFFVSRTVTIEPEFYYKQSFKDHNNLSGLGLRIGVGIYLE